MCSFTGNGDIGDDVELVEGKYIRDDAKSVVLHDERVTDSGEQTLLHSTFKAKYRHLWGRLQKIHSIFERHIQAIDTYQFDIHSYFPCTNPRQDDPVNMCYQSGRFRETMLTRQSSTRYTKMPADG